MTPPTPITKSPYNSTRQLLRLAMPMIGVMVSRMLMGFIDFAMVSVLGTEAQAAISPASILVFAVICIGMGAASTVQTFASQAVGRGEPSAGSAYAWQTFYIAAVCGVCVLPVIAAVPAFFHGVGAWAGHAPEVQRLEIEYTRIALWSFAPSVICSGLDGFFNGIGRARLGLISVLIAIVFNVVANYALIFGHWGFPEMGIGGAAIATVGAWCIRTLILILFFCSSSIDRVFHTRRTLAPSRSMLAGIIRIGLPTSLNWLFDIGAWVVFMMIIIPPFGTVAMAASNVGLQFMHLSFMPAVGLGMALCTQVGVAIGEGRPNEVVDRTRTALRVMMVYMGGIGLLFFFGRFFLMRIMTSDPEVIQAGALVLIWAAVFQLFDAMCITYIHALRGAGDTRWPAAATVFCCWVIFIGGGYAIIALAPGWNISGPWFMCTSYIILLGILLWWRFRGGAWRSIRIFDAKPLTPAGAQAASPDSAPHPLDPA